LLAHQHKLDPANGTAMAGNDDLIADASLLLAIAALSGGSTGSILHKAHHI
jgi:hypothetical protein